MFLIYDNNEDRAYIHQAHHNLEPDLGIAHN